MEIKSISTGAIHIHGTATQTAKHTIYDEVNYVKLSQIISVKELGSVDLSKWDWMWTNGKLLRRRRKSAHRTIRTVKIYPDRQSKFAAITYEGEDAHEAWEEDLQRFLRVSGPDSLQLFGINKWKVPMLIFHNEVIPLAHFFTDSLWMNVYIAYLKVKKRCYPRQLWMDMSGVICDGPIGPAVSSWNLDLDESIVRAVPSSLDMLKESSAFSASLNQRVLQSGHKKWRIDTFIAQEEVSLTAVFDDSAELWKGWLSQSPHVFATFETVACQGSFFAVNPPQDEFVDSVDHCDTDSDEDSVGFCDEKEETAPIYLFLYPPPMTILELIPWMGGRTHFWSLDETGQSKMSKEECEQRGLPSLFAATLYSRGSVELCSWPAHIYVALRDWQVARGFDPNTADWARHMGYPDFEITRGKRAARGNQ
uniref:Uncharacterized protein n=1 Tax=Moniliophthora roreri TaxID=221103 RepID=A0A0W0FW01_MONRR